MRLGFVPYDKPLCDAVISCGFEPGGEVFVGILILLQSTAFWSYSIRFALICRMVFMTYAPCARYEEAFRSQLQELGEDPDQIAPWLSPEKLLSMYSHSLAQNISMAVLVVQVKHMT